jgi:hypothetical protein
VKEKTLLETAKELLEAAKSNPEQFQELGKAQKEPPASPAIKPPAEKPMRKSRVEEENEKRLKRHAENQRRASERDRKPMKKEETCPGEPTGGQISSESPSTADTGTRKGESTMAAEPVGGQISSEKPLGKEGMMMAAKPPAPAPAAHAQPAAQDDGSMHHAMKLLDTPEKQVKMLHHLKGIHEKPAGQPGGMPAKPMMQKPAAPAPAQGPAVQKNDDMPGTSTAGIGPAMTGALANSEKVIAMAKELIKASKDDPKAFDELMKTSTLALALSEQSAAKPQPDPSPFKDNSRPAPNPNPGKDPSPFKDNSKPAPNPAPGKDPSPFKDNSKPAPNPNPGKDPSPFKDNSKPAPNPAPGKDPSPFSDKSKPAPNPNPMPASKILGKTGMRMTKEEIQEDMKKEWKPKHLKRCM